MIYFYLFFFSLIIYVHETLFKKEVLKKVTHIDVGWS